MRLRLRHAAAVAWAALVAVLLLMPPGRADAGELPEWLWRLVSRAAEMGADKVVHGGLFGVLAFLAARSFTGLPALRWPLVAAALTAALYGLLLEVLQALSPGRSAELSDGAANLAGATLGALSAWWLRAPRSPGPGSRGLV